MVVAPSKMLKTWGREFHTWKPQMRPFYSPEYAEGLVQTRTDWDTADVLVGSLSQPPIDGATIRRSTGSGWPPSCWIRVVSYDFYWSLDLMEKEIFTHNVSMVAFDEVKGFENPFSRTVSILREWRTHSPSLFVLPTAGTLFSPSCANACYFLKAMGFDDVEPKTRATRFRTAHLLMPQADPTASAR